MLQGDTLFTIAPGENVKNGKKEDLGDTSLERLKEEPFFWIDVNGFNETDLSHIATVTIPNVLTSSYPNFCRTLRCTH